MRARSITSAGSALVFALMACDSTGPSDKDVAEFIIDFCSDETPEWVAFQNDGGPWTRVIPNSSGSVTVLLTERFGFAVSAEDASGPFTDVVYGTRTEFSSLNGVTCNEQFGTKTLNGTVAGLTGAQIAEITMGLAFEVATSGAPQFQLAELPERPLDIVAQRVPGAGAVAERFIIRRAVTFASGATLTPPLDFSAAPPATQPSATNLVAVTGLAAGESNFATVIFRTATGTEHVTRDASFTTAPITVPYVPASLSQSGDLHETFVLAISSSTPTARGVTQFQRLPGNRTAALGAVLNTPTVSNAAPTGAPRLRAELASQAEYGGFASVDFFQNPAGIERHFSVTQTSGYNGNTPATWVLEMPDLAAVNGFPADAVFEDNALNEWFIEAASGGAGVFVSGQATGVEGLSVKFADRASALPMLLSRTPGAPAPRRNPLLRSLRSRR